MRETVREKAPFQAVEMEYKETSWERKRGGGTRESGSLERTGRWRAVTGRASAQPGDRATRGEEACLTGSWDQWWCLLCASPWARSTAEGSEAKEEGGGGGDQGRRGTRWPRGWGGARAAAQWENSGPAASPPATPGPESFSCLFRLSLPAAVETIGPSLALEHRQHSTTPVSTTLRTSLDTDSWQPKRIPRDVRDTYCLFGKEPPTGAGIHPSIVLGCPLPMGGRDLQWMMPAGKRGRVVGL